MKSHGFMVYYHHVMSEVGNDMTEQKRLAELGESKEQKEARGQIWNSRCAFFYFKMSAAFGTKPRRREWRQIYLRLGSQTSDKTESAAPCRSGQCLSCLDLCCR